jgi:hypothetical protein
MLVVSELCVCEVLHASEDNSELGAPERIISSFLRLERRYRPLRCYQPVLQNICGQARSVLKIAKTAL